MTSPTLQWSINFTNTSNQATTVRIKLGLNNVATGTGILYTVPRFTSLTITGASPYAPTIASGTEVSAFIESSTVARVNSVTIKLDSGVSALTVDQTIIDGSTNPVSGNAVFDGLALKQNTISGTANYLTKFGSGGVVQSSIVDDGTAVAIVTSDARLRGGDNAGRFILGNSTTTSYLELGGSTYTTPNEVSLITTTGNLNFFTNAISRIKVVNAGRVLFGTTTDDLTNIIQANGTISASPATLSNQVVVLSQISGLAPLASPTFTGTPTAPTATAGTNTTQVATTAFVTSQTITGDKVFLTSTNGIVGKTSLSAQNTSNLGSAIGITNSSTGIGISASNTGGGDAFNIGNSSNGRGFIIRGTSTGTNIISDIGTTGTGLNYVGQNNGTNTFTVDKLGVITATAHNLSALNTAPASATATGTLGEIRVTATHIYVCTATNTWVRTALTTW
jgi:hypothetical protein